MSRPCTPAPRPAAAFVFAALLPHAAAAQEGPPQRGPWVFGLEGGGVLQFDSSLDGGGDVSVSRAFTQASLNYGFDRRTSVGLSLGAGVTSYDFSGATFGGGSPWSDARDLRVSLPVRFGVTDSINALVIPSVRWNGEDGADSDESRTEGVIAAAIWRYSDSLSIGPGFGLFSALEGDASFFPFLALDWDVTERINLGTGGGLGASEGPGLVLTYAVRDDLRLGLGARRESIEFRLDDNGVAPGGVGREEGWPIFATAQWRPAPFASISAVGGIEVGGELTLENARGNKVDDAGFDPAPFVGLTASLRF